MFLLTFEATPKHDNPEVSEIGGAFINCWITGDDIHKAELDARQHIDISGWIISSKSEESIVERDDYAEEPDELAYYTEAEEYGACFVFHTWPLGSEDNDS
jgi:hypothetical protein